MVSILFWTPWCGHCNPVIPIFEELSVEIPDVTFVLVNKDEGERIAKRFDIFSVPFLLFIKNGEVINSRLGGIEKVQLRDLIISIK